MTKPGLEKSGAPSEIDSEERTFQAASRSLIGSMFVLLKVALVHEMENRAVGPALNRFRVALGEFQRKCAESAAIQFVGDGVYLNRRLVRADHETWQKASFIKDFLGRLDIAEVSFAGDVAEQSIRDFVSAARHAVLEPNADEALKKQSFAGISFRDLDAEGIERSDDAVVLPDPIRVVRAFGIIVVTVRHYFEELRSGGSPQLLPLRRAVQEFVRLPVHTQSLQLGVLALEQYRGELAGRQARVGVIVVMMGKRLELGVADLRELGVAAILAGAGRVFSEELAFQPVEVCAEQEVFTEGARRFARSKGSNRSSALRLIAATELGRSFGGLERHPLTRLLSVAESYEHLTAPKPRGEGLYPGDAQQKILNSHEHDHAAARLLVATLGLFPVGSMVRLSSGETAIIVEGPQSTQDVNRPQVMLVTDARGRPVRKRILDLAETGATIQGTINASKLDLNLGHFLFT